MAAAGFLSHQVPASGSARVCVCVGRRWEGVRSLGGKGKEVFLFNDALKHILFTVIWRRTYGKGPF